MIAIATAIWEWDGLLNLTWEYFVIYILVSAWYGMKETQAKRKAAMAAERQVARERLEVEILTREVGQQALHNHHEVLMRHGAHISNVSHERILQWIATGFYFR